MFDDFMGYLTPKLLCPDCSAYLCGRCPAVATRLLIRND